MTLRIEIDSQTPRSHVLACVNALTAFAGLTEGALLVTGEAVAANPHTGEPRDYRDVASDPGAILCVKPGEPLRPAAPPVPPPPIVLAPAQVAAMDETAGLVPVPPVPAASPAPEAVDVAQRPIVPADGSVFSVPSVPTPPAPPAPAAAAPSAPAATTSPVVGGELDTRGFPWNDRIHTSTKSQNQDGTWRQLRNIDKKSPGLVAQVEAEMRAQGYLEPVANTVGAALSAVPAPATGAVVPPPPTVPAPPQVPAPPAVPTPPAPPAVPAPPGVLNSVVKPTTVIGMLSKIAQLTEEGNGMLSEDEVEGCCKAVGLTALVHLAEVAKVDATIVTRLDAEIERVLAS